MYALEDLAPVFDLSHAFTLSDYPTVFALFLAALIETLRFDLGNKVLFVATDARHRRFGFLMANARAAARSPVSGDDPEAVTFVLEDWVYPALTRYLAAG